MGSGGASWETGDVISAARMQQKTLFVGTGAEIAAISPTYAGMLAYCTSTGSGFTAGKLYERNVANDAWATVGAAALSDLAIDVNKDWNTKKIANLGAPTASGDAFRLGDQITDTMHGSRGSGLHSDSHVRSHALDSTLDHSGTITDTQHGSRGSGLHADSHARSHDHSQAGDGSPIALAGIPTPLTGKDADTVDTYHAAAFEKTANKDAASGYAGLTAGGELSKAACVNAASLKTSTGEYSADHYSGAYVTLAGGMYSFFPQVKMGTYTHSHLAWQNIAYTTSGTYATLCRVGGDAESGSGGYLDYATNRYVSSTGPWELPYFIYILLKEGSFLASWSAPDPPWYGTEAAPEDFPHPFLEYLAPQPGITVVLVDSSDLDIEKMKIEANSMKKSLLEHINTDYLVESVDQEPDGKPQIRKFVAENNIKFRRLVRR